MSQKKIIVEFGLIQGILHLKTILSEVNNIVKESKE